MSIRASLVLAMVFSAGVAGCGGPAVTSDQPAGRAGQKSGAPAPGAVSGEHAAGQLSGVVETYFEENLKLNPITATFVGEHRYDDRLALSIGPAHRKKQLELEQRFLDALLEIDKGDLAGQDLLTYEIFERGRRNGIEGFRYPAHLIPINQFFSIPNFFATLAAGTSVHPFNTVEDYDNMLSRMDDFEKWMDQAIVNMREGIDAGVVQPRVIMEKVLPQLAAQINGDPEKTVFYGAVNRMPDSFADADRQRLQNAYKEKIANKIVPSYQRLHDFIRDEYVGAARASVGVTELPGGTDWYAYLVRLQTTTSLTPDEIHEIGLTEVERITAEMESIRAEVGFDGDLQAFFGHLRTDPQFYHDQPEQLLESYRALKSTLAAAAPDLFSLIPEADFEVRAVEPFREQSAAGAFYMRAAPDGSRPGVFFVNTYNIKSRPKYAAEALYLHEAVPGHHFQISLQQELEDLPAVRRFGGFTAYVEGWGLYAETLGEELGLYTDPYQRFGAFDAQMVRAIRLVADTGMHAKGWTRELALQFMMDHSSISETRAVAEIERYIAIPGQALAYKIGQLKISELRARAEQALGADFDVRDFHAQLLADGSLPLDVLEAKIDRWIRQSEMNIVKRFPACLATLVLSGAALAQAQAQAQTIPGADMIQSRTLDNGMKIIVWPDHDIPNIALYNWVRAGGRNEYPGITGIAHYFEHMMFNGTKNRPPGEFDRVMQANGGSNNAYTSNDVTVYMDWFPRSALEIVLSLEADRIQNLDFDPEVVESERGVVYSERRLRVDNSNAGKLQEQIQATAFVAHPYQFPVIGWPSDIESWTLDDLKAFYKTYYAPNNATLLLVGDITPQEGFALAEKYLGPIPAQTPPAPLRTVEPPQQGERRIELKLPAQTPILQMVWHSGAADDETMPALNLLVAILGRGDSSRLHRLLVEQEQAAINVGAYVQEGFDPGLTSIYAVLPQGGDLAQAERLIDESVARIIADGVTADELDKAKNLWTAGFWRGMATIDGKADALGTYELFHGDYRKLFDAADRYEQVTAEQIRAVAASVLLPANRTVGVVIPTDEEGN